MSIYSTESKKTIIARLKSLGVVRCEVAYSGGGDSGAIDSVTVYFDGVVDGRSDIDVVAAENETEAAKVVINVTDRLLGEKTSSFNEEIESLCYGALDYVGAPDWCNNDGGCGTMTIYVEAGEGDQEGDQEGSIRIDHSTYYTETHNSSFTL